MHYYMITCSDTTVLYEFGNSKEDIHSLMSNNYAQFNVVRVDQIS